MLFHRCLRPALAAIGCIVLSAAAFPITAGRGNYFANTPEQPSQALELGGVLEKRGVALLRFAHKRALSSEEPPQLTERSSERSHPDHIAYYVRHFKPNPKLKPLTFALRDFGRFFVSASSRKHPTNTEILLVDKTGLVTVAPKEAILQHFARKMSVASEDNRVATMIELGPGFAPRRRMSSLSNLVFGYRTPNISDAALWDHVDGNTADVGQVWRLLNHKRRLVVVNRESSVAYALDKAGNVLKHVL
ncbi:methyltransferases [Moesziomyces antarcticus T-34]|uniref:Methyltransferases n=1 Tax=Pseudozyma antarctica (strain T-34) TaxID=1151754 RepID=M9LYD2_PSEA3|nr:methyltransferases [Moesziomyces antarcticus T-34]